MENDANGMEKVGHEVRRTMYVDGTEKTYFFWRGTGVQVRAG